MKLASALTTIFLPAILVVALSSCQMLSKSGLGAKQPQQGTAQQPGTAGTTGGEQPGGMGGAQPGAPSVSGYWQVAFQLGDKTFKANMRLKQTGTTFTGEGSDDPSGREFVIEEGELQGDQVVFYKKYPGLDPNQAPPVEYGGKIEMVTEGDLKGPYMSGEYATTYQGQPVRGIWEAQMVQAETAEAGGQPAEPPEGARAGTPPSPPPAVDTSRAPHLSGKWNVGYEYQFKTIKSVMYLEQDGGKLTGHGQDLNTREKFTIEKGWYNYPRVTLVRKYTKGKGAAADRTMTFKAEVKNVSDADYQGPYMAGKTDGGGAWEAQMFR
jgi:hypothetical protein